MLRTEPLPTLEKPENSVRKTMSTSTITKGLEGVVAAIRDSADVQDRAVCPNTERLQHLKIADAKGLSHANILSFDDRETNRVRLR